MSTGGHRKLDYGPRSPSQEQIQDVLGPNTCTNLGNFLKQANYDSKLDVQVNIYLERGNKSQVTKFYEVNTTNIQKKIIFL